ncbi:Uncharacterised protein [Vibrio harveyi]|nr:Uncharacterised protein [Vibrio harveyi]
MLPKGTLCKYKGLGLYTLLPILDLDPLNL